MSVCITANTLDPRSIYPVLDPRRFAGTGPFHFACTFAWDAVQIDVGRNTGMPSCQMVVNFVDLVGRQRDPSVESFQQQLSTESAATAWVSRVP